MATKAELLAKIEKAKANKMMPDALKTQYISKIQKELDALDAKSAPKKASKEPEERYKIQWFNKNAKPPRVEDKIFTGEKAFEDAKEWGKKTLENFNVDQIQATTDSPSAAQTTNRVGVKPFTPGQGAKTKANKAGLLLAEYESQVVNQLEEQGEMTRSDAQGIAETKGNTELIVKNYKVDVSAAETAKKILNGAGEGKKKGASKPEKDTTFVVFDSKGKPDSMQISEDAAKKYISRRPKASQSEMKYKEMASDEAKKLFDKKGVYYDCDELIKNEIERANARKESAKKSAAKSPAKKSGDAIEKTTDAIEKKAEEGELTKDQILQLIQKFKKEIRRLEKLLKTAK